MKTNTMKMAMEKGTMIAYQNNYQNGETHDCFDHNEDNNHDDNINENNIVMCKDGTCE